jgi:hypothetical protein
MKTMAAASLVLLAACAHARDAEDPSSAQAGPEARADAEEPSEAAAQKQAAGDPSGKATDQKQGRVAGGAEDPGEIPVASSPSGLMKPGAEQKIREKLGVKAGSGSLRQALQKFQKEHDLPATGILDQRTVESLGLDPDDVFEQAKAQ